MNILLRELGPWLRADTCLSTGGLESSLSRIPTALLSLISLSSTVAKGVSLAHDSNNSQRKREGKSSTAELQNHAKFRNSRFQTLGPEDSAPQQCGICSVLWLCLPRNLLFASSVLVKSSTIFSPDYLPRLGKLMMWGKRYILLLILISESQHLTVLRE